MTGRDSDATSNAQRSTLKAQCSTFREDDFLIVRARLEGDGSFDPNSGGKLRAHFRWHTRWSGALRIDWAPQGTSL